MAGTKKAKNCTRRGRTPRTRRPLAIPVPVENIRAGTILHLGDGRRIGFGEIAEVRPSVAEALARSGQAKRTGS